MAPNRDWLTTRWLRSTAVLGLLAAVAAPVSAQRADKAPFEPATVVKSVDPALPDLDIARVRQEQRSAFNLRSASDVAFSGLRLVGTYNWFVANASPLDYNYSPGYGGYLLHRGAWRHNFFEFTLMAGVPRSNFVKYRDQIPSLRNIRNEDGYSAVMNGRLLGGPINFSAADNTLGAYFSGVASTTDGTCHDHSAARGGYLQAGVTLLAGSNCLDTWGSLGWQGERPILGGDWADLFQQRGHDFAFNWWEVPDERKAAGFIGNFQTYGLISDYYAERLAEYGAVIPGGSGRPIKEGYPLGLDIKFDAYSFTLPTVANAVFWQATVTNNSARVYGTGMDYDSLFIGFSPQPSNSLQESATYYEPWSGSIRWVNNGVNVGCNGAAAASQACATHSQRGFYWGATQAIVLNSPIGDLRNKLFTRAGDFYDPSHPHAGDTITYNHGHICGYGSCAGSGANALMSGRDRRRFGMLSSTEANVMDGRPASDLTDANLHITFRSPEWPDNKVQFARYVPGDWTYSNRPPGAPMGPDTLYVDTCYGSGPARQQDGGACVVTWSDSLPSGHVNRYGNVQMFGIGPFPLKAGESTKITLAIMGAQDSLGIEELQRNVIDLYLNFFLSPQPPATAASTVQLPAALGGGVHVNEPQAIVATDVEHGGLNEAAVTLFLSDAAENWIDPFLIDYYNKLTTAPEGTELARLHAMNPWLAGTVLAAAQDNAEAMYIYKSCTGGTTWTANSNCIGDPATDEFGAPVGNGWRPAIVLRADASGNFPNSVRDPNVRGGVTYLYSVSLLSRGLTVQVVDSVGGVVVGREIEIAPQLLSPIASAVSDPNVARVYVPMTVQGGGSRAIATVLEEGQQGPARVPYNRFTVRLAGEPQTEAVYRVVFADSAHVTRTESSTTVVLFRSVTNPATGVREPITESFTYPSGTILTINAPTATTTGDLTRVTTLGALVVRTSDGAPMLLTTVLDGTNTTPGSYLTRADFPNFTLLINNTSPGTFFRAFYLDAAGDTLLARVQPSVTWRNADIVRRSTTHAVGEYVTTWGDRAFGPGAPFTITFENPATTSAEVQASLNARAVVSTGSVSAEDWALVKAVLLLEYPNTGFSAAAHNRVLSLDESALVAVKLPFTIANETFGRQATIVMLSREERARLAALAQGLDPEGVDAAVARANQITLGTGVDIQRGVEVPRDTWIPGDRLYLIETVSTQTDPPTRVVTMSNVTLGCADPRLTCNPVRGRGSSPYVSPQPGFKLVAQYFVPFTSESEFLVRVAPARMGGLLAAADVSVADVLFTPNPYLARSRYEQGGSRETVAYFVNMPPEGTIRIYTVAGHFVQQIRWTAEDLMSSDQTAIARERSSGDLRWDLRTREGNELASGLYVFVVEAAGKKKIGKFVVIR
jgi:hypothetical protein